MNGLHNASGIRTVIICIAFTMLADPAMAIPLSDLLRDKSVPRPQGYKTAGTAEQQLWCFAPSDLKPGDRRPAVVCIHGGAWVAGNADVFFPHARYFATRGAVAFSINYRLLKPNGPALGDCLADCKSAIRYIRSHAAEFGVDPSRIAVLGDSAGGHLAAALGTIQGFDNPGDDLNVSATPNAMIACNAIMDMTEGGWLKFVIGGKALEKNATPEASTPTEDDIILAWRLSPLFNVHPGQPPALVMQGLDDHVVEPGQARQFAAAMRAANNRCDLVLIEGARHAFILPNYTASESIVVSAIREADEYLISLGWLSGEPTLEVSSPPAWLEKPAHK